MFNIFVRTEVDDSKLYDCEQILIDNGIEQNEACTVLQAIGFALLDEDLYPEEA